MASTHNQAASAKPTQERVDGSFSPGLRPTRFPRTRDPGQNSQQGTPRNQRLVSYPPLQSLIQDASSPGPPCRNQTDSEERDYQEYARMRRKQDGLPPIPASAAQSVEDGNWIMFGREMRQLTKPWTRQDLHALVCLEDTGETKARRDILTHLNREHKEYVDRNISEAPQTTPGSPVPAAQQSLGFFLYNGEEVSSIAVQRMENKAQAIFEEYTAFSRSASLHPQIPTATFRRQGQPNPSVFKRKRGDDVFDFESSAKRKNEDLERNYDTSDAEFPSTTICSTKSVPLETIRNSKHQGDQSCTNFTDHSTLGPQDDLIRLPNNPTPSARFSNEHDIPTASTLKPFENTSTFKDTPLAPPLPPVQLPQQKNIVLPGDAISSTKSAGHKLDKPAMNSAEVDLSPTEPVRNSSQSPQPADSAAELKQSSKKGESAKKSETKVADIGADGPKVESILKENPPAKRNVAPVEAADPNVMQSNLVMTVEGEIQPSTPMTEFKSLPKRSPKPLGPLLSQEARKALRKRRF